MPKGYKIGRGITEQGLHHQRQEPHLPDVVIGCPNLTNSDAYWRCECILHQPVDLVGQRCREQQCLPVWPHLAND